jgi:hypothetical protein
MQPIRAVGKQIFSFCLMMEMLRACATGFLESPGRKDV